MTKRLHPGPTRPSTNERTKSNFAGSGPDFFGGGRHRNVLIAGTANLRWWGIRINRSAQQGKRALEGGEGQISRATPGRPISFTRKHALAHQSFNAVDRSWTGHAAGRLARLQGR